MPDEVHVAVVEEQPVMRWGLRALLANASGITVASMCATGVALLELLPSLEADVVVGDPHDLGIAAAALVPLLRRHAARLLLYTDRAGDNDVIDALRSGAAGHVSRRAGEDTLVDAIHAVARGERYVDEAALAALGRATLGQEERTDHLTERESDVLRLLTDGLTVREIASRLYIGEGTVKTHINQIYRKLEVHNRAGATAYALRVGFVT